MLKSNMDINYLSEEIIGTAVLLTKESIKGTYWTISGSYKDKPY
jgi:hypothetical protein